ncbi:MAG: DNA polymerase III subunit alpha [Acidobacteriota bacterium]|nr:DNA polymerase III subunit alpha [Acidobacteriota bacterium]
MFFHLHIHSYFSMMWGTAPIDVLAKHLAEQGQPVFPLTDRNGMYGMVHQLRACEEYGLRPIIGCELVTPGHRALCLVKTRTGYRNLNRMLTDHYHNPDWSLDEALLESHQGLVIITQNEELLQLLHPDADIYIDLFPGAAARADALHRKYGAPQVVTSHAYTISERAHRLHLLMRAIGTNSKLSRLPPGSFEPPESCLYDNDFMSQRFAAYPKALNATREIAEACSFAPGIGEPIFPPSEYSESYKTLRDKTYAGLHRRYGRITDTIRERADYELDMIRRKGFSNCFLVIEDVVTRFSLTCGRGSAASSIVSYALGITHVEPIEHNLFFERFLNPGRVDPPDIDVDFAWDERDHVRDYLWQKYGRSHIAMVCNQNRFRPRSAIREIAKVYGLGEKEMTEMKRALYKARKGGDPPRLAEPWPEILKLAKRIEDYPRQISVHCGGVVITPDDIANHCPLRPMPIGYDVIPWEKDGAEDYGFVKLDFLGNRSLAVIRDTLASVRENYGVGITYESFNPLGDPQAKMLIQKGQTMGCFYVESPATRQLLEKTRMGDFETLVAISSIIRPAANKISSEWVKRHRWMSKPARKPNWKVIHPKLEEVLVETHGLMVYQEDVTRTAMAVAGFDAVMGDKLRKILSKKDKQKLSDIQARFVEGCRKNGLNNDQISEIWTMMQSFAGYSFCKPHSASYALVSFKSAFLKAHYPAEFMASVISNQGGFYSTYAYLSHARRLGLEVLGPDINDSRIVYHGRDGTIRIGFMQIKGLRRESMRLIMEAREDGPFRDLEDFLHRVPISLEEAKRLILAGCFDALESETNRPTLNWRALYWYALHQNQAEDLFPDYIRREDLPTMEPYSRSTRLLLEQKLFGFWVTEHPLTRYSETLKNTRRIHAVDLPRFRNRTVCLAGWLITGKTVTTHKGEPMSFLTFEDETGVFETVLFPDVYRKRAHLVDYARPFLVRGEIVSDMGSLSLTIHDLERLDDPARRTEELKNFMNA